MPSQNWSPSLPSQPAQRGHRGEEEGDRNGDVGLHENQVGEQMEKHERRGGEMWEKDEGHVEFVFEETGRLPLETGEPEEVIWGKSASGNTA